MKKPKIPQKGLDTHLFHACREGNSNYAYLALAAGANVNSRDADGLTPLHKATEFGNGTIVSLLFAQGADPQAKDRTGRTPMEVARFNGDVQIAKFLESIDGQTSHAARVTKDRTDKAPRIG